MKAGVRYTSALAILVVCTAIGRAGGIGWPEAVARLTKERSKAEVCVASLKGRGNSEQVSRGRLAYGAAKVDLDAVIAGLMTALSEGGNRESLPSLEAELERGASGQRSAALHCGTEELGRRCSEGGNRAVDQTSVRSRLGYLCEFPQRQGRDTNPVGGGQMARLRHGAGNAIAPAPARACAEIFRVLVPAAFSQQVVLFQPDAPDVALILVNALSTKARPS